MKKGLGNVYKANFDVISSCFFSNTDGAISGVFFKTNILRNSVFYESRLKLIVY